MIMGNKWEEFITCPQGLSIYFNLFFLWHAVLVFNLKHAASEKAYIRLDLVYMLI